MLKSKPSYRTIIWALTGLTTVIGAGATHAQVIERNLPNAPKNKDAVLPAPNAVPSEQDASPIGPALQGIVLIGPNEATENTNASDIVIRKVARLDAARIAIMADLKPYLGQVLSRKLIAEIEAKIARRYRLLGYPFVSLSTPEQEISNGVLHIRVVEFTVGEVNQNTDQPSNAVSLKSGDAINADQLSDDLAWINRYPFAQTNAEFSPGAKAGTTDLNLTTNTYKPWQVYGGVANSGTESTGIERYFVGGSLGNLLGRKSILSYQATGSRDAFAGSKRAQYKSHALNYSLPVGRHKQVEFAFNSVETNQSLNPFIVGLNLNEGTLAYRFGVNPRLFGGGQTDIRIGTTAKYQKGTTYFGGTNVLDVSVEDYQLFAGLHHKRFLPKGTSELELVFHLSPGNVNKGNSNAQAFLYSQGRLKTAAYAYISLAYDLSYDLPKGFGVKSKLSAQLASHALPRTEQTGLGGAYQVRGYSLDSGAFDTAFVLRNALYLPSKTQKISPYVFVDLGTGKDLFLKKSQSLASVGFGAQANLNRNTVLHLDVANARRKSGATKSGAWTAHASLSFSF